MVEAKKTPADSSQEISYKYFAEQIDRETGVPVGMVPLEVVFDHGLINLPENAKWHDVGSGVFASTKYILSKIPEQIRRSLTVVTSDPVIPDATTREGFARNYLSFVLNDRYHPLDANAAVLREQQCDIITMINMIHNVEEAKRPELFEETYSSLIEGGKLLLSTSFMDKWWANRETMYLQAFWKRAREAEVAERGLAIGEVNFELWPAERYIQELETAGFEIDYKSVEIMPCTVESYELISHDAEWLGNTMPGVDLKTASDISICALRKVASEKQWDKDYPLPRNTLVVVAGKPDYESVSSDSGTETKAPVKRELVLV